MRFGIFVAIVLALPASAAAHPGWTTGRVLDPSSNVYGLGANDSGDMLIAWTAGGSPTFEMRAAFRPSGEPIGPPSTILTGDGPQQFGAAVALNDTGTAVLSWSESRLQPFRTYVSVARPGGGFGEAQRPSNDDVGNLRVAVDQAGNVLAVWSEFVTNAADRDFVIRAAWQRVGEDAFGPPITVATGRAEGIFPYAEAPAVAVAEGSVFVLTYETFGRVRLATATAGGDFGAPVDMGAGDFPQIGANRRGDIALAWNEAQGASGLTVVVRRPGQGFGQPTALPPADSLSPAFMNQVPLSVDRNGNVAIRVRAGRSPHGLYQPELLDRVALVGELVHGRLEPRPREVGQLEPLDYLPVAA